jgi:hypothetical protein
MTTDKQRLLAQAKKSIEAGEKKLREAAEALAKAQEEHGATQQEMAKAVGKSQAWVCHLLQWRREGYKSESPFGPTTKAGREYQHADKISRQRGRTGKSKNKDLNLKVVPKNISGPQDADDPEKAKTINADDPVEKAKAVIRDWFANMTPDQKTAVVAFVIETSGVPMAFGRAA